MNKIKKNLTKQNICNDISIVIQGPLSINSINNVAENCKIWKNILPNSEIILSISHTDDFELVDGINLKSKNDGIINNNSIKIINNICNHIIISPQTESLPEIKRDSTGKNNINYQIKSSFLGLKKAKNNYALKIRSDMVFKNTDFIDFYLDNYLINRGKRKCLQHRVLIPSMYTLNPFSKERMPFHFSDWFQFGTTNDLKTIWSIDYFSLNDAIFYRNNSYVKNSNNLEKLFLTRIAVEQYISYSLAKKFFPDLQLEYHNDTTSIVDSIEFLIDNFIVMNSTSNGIFFPKYRKEIIDYNNIKKCISYEEWLFMSKNRDENFKNFLMRNDEVFYIIFGPNDLFCKESVILNKNIVNSSMNGVLSYGPYFDIENGLYFCDVLFDKIYGFGYLTIKITANFGKKLISKKMFFVFGKKNRNKITFPFLIEKRLENSVEIVIGYKFFKKISLSRIIIHN